MVLYKIKYNFLSGAYQMAKKTKARKKRLNIKLMPVYAMAAFVPLIVYMKRIKRLC